MNRNIVLIRLKSYINSVTPPLGIGYLLKALREVEGIAPVFIDAHRDDLDQTALLDKIRGLDPLIIGFQLFSVDYAEFRKCLGPMRRLFPKAVIMAGGPHVSGLPEQTLLENQDLDFVVKGEGEAALSQMARLILEKNLDPSLHLIPNLAFRENGAVKVNKTVYADVESWGAPDWEMLEPHKYPAVQHGMFHRSDKVVPILTSRGCPYPCTYCAGHLLTGKKIRKRSAKSIVDEIQHLSRTYGFTEFIIEDENFTFYKEHVRAVKDEIVKRKIRCHFSLPNGIRLDRLDEQIADDLKQMGAYMVTFGIESGSKKTLKAMKKNWDLDMIRAKVRLLKKRGIIVNGSFILGFSGETMADIRKTVDFALSCGIDTAYFGNYIPLPGSKDFMRMKAAGELDTSKIDWRTYTSYFGKLPYHPEAVSEEELLKAIRRATLKFYLRPAIMLGILKRISKPIFLKSMLFRVLSLYR